MAEPILVYRICQRCGGDGIFPNMETDPVTGELYQPENTTTCDSCDGEGKQVVGFIVSEFQEQIDDIQDKINDVLDKCNDIFEKLNE